MHMQQAKYELLNEKHNLRQKHTYMQVCLLFTLCAMSSLVVYATWTVIYRKNFNYPPKSIEIPELWIDRANKFSEFNSNQNHYLASSLLIGGARDGGGGGGGKSSPSSSSTTVQDNNYVNINVNNNNSNNQSIIYNENIKQIENEKIYPSKLGNFIYSQQTVNSNKIKLVCYYAAPLQLNQTTELYPKNIDPHLCTHINVGIVPLANNQLYIDDNMKEYFRQTTHLKKTNENLKVLLWVGGADGSGFSEMVVNHANRKLFIQSLKATLEEYRLDGIDIDWEFPSAFHKERMHFSQLLHEIRREYQREHRTYLLSVAVASPKSIVDQSYDVREINSYADYVNIMTYDYHYYTRVTPMTGFNAPLYQRHDEGGFLATLNINYTINYWVSQGLSKDKIIIGLPTYGHSFRLVNPFNTAVRAPAEGFGNVGSMGFVTYSDVCWFRQNNIYVTTVYDMESCSPYLYAGTEWISYENERSLECKTNYIKSNGFGGAMIFSLNCDDHVDYCAMPSSQLRNSEPNGFPLVRKINSILFENLRGGDKRQTTQNVRNKANSDSVES